MTVVLINPFWAGHHGTFYRFITQAIGDLGHSVITLSQSPSELNDVTNINIQIDPKHTSIGKSLREKEGFLRYCNDKVTDIANTKKLTIDLVFFLTLDSLLHKQLSAERFDTFFSYPWSGLYFTPRPKKKSLSKKIKTLFKKKPLSLFESTRCRSVGILDEGYKNTLEKQIKKQVVVFPDFIDASEANMDFAPISAILQHKGEKKIIGLYGALEKRKGVLTFLQAASKNQNGEWFFVMAGKLKRDYFNEKENSLIDAFIESPPSNCFFYLDHIPTEKEFNAFISISDLIFAAYHDFPHSSNLITKAACFNKPLVVSKGYLMDERVRNHQLGWGIRQDNINDLLQLLSVQNIQEFSAPKAEDYCKHQSITQLRNALKSVLSP